MMVTVSDLGEYALIERVENFIQLRQLEHRPEIKLIAGIGDDAAAWQVSGIQVTTTDSMVEDVLSSIRPLDREDRGLVKTGTILAIDDNLNNTDILKKRLELSLIHI